MMEEKNQDENEDLPNEMKEPTPLFDEDIKRSLEKIKKYHEDLDNKLEQIYRTSGLTPQKIVDYLDNQANFTEFEWKRLQSLKKGFDDKLLKLFPEREKEQRLKKQLKGKKKLRGKALGKRKKWIEMD